MARPPGRRLHRLVAVAVAGAALAAGCASSGYQYVKNSDDRTYFRVPDRWKLYDEDALLDEFAADLSPRERRRERNSTWQVAFDASPEPDLAHLVDAKARHPAGIAVVRDLSFADADAISTEGLRNLFFDIDGAVENEAGELLEYEPLEPDGGFRGMHVVANLDQPDGDGILTVDQTSLVDQATRKVYSLLVSCSAQCYADSRDRIDRVVGSWTVEET